MSFGVIAVQNGRQIPKKKSHLWDFNIQRNNGKY